MQTPAAPATPAPAAPAAALPAPAVTPPPPPPPVVATPTARNPADAAAWDRWDRAASGLREIGLTVRPSGDPTHLEIVVPGNRMSLREAQILVKGVYHNMGGGQSSVTLFNEAGLPVTEATIRGVQ